MTDTNEPNAWVVWSNKAKVEGVIFRDQFDALWTATGKRQYLTGIGYPSMGHDFREDCCDGDIKSRKKLPMTALFIPIEGTKK